MSINGEPGGWWFKVAGTAGKPLMRAIVDTYDHCERNGVKASADTLIVSDDRFSPLLREIRERWAAFTEFPAWQFPWRDDFIRHGWVTFRKSISSKTHNNEIRSWVGIGIGADPGLSDQPMLFPDD